MTVETTVFGTSTPYGYYGGERIVNRAKVRQHMHYFLLYTELTTRPAWTPTRRQVGGARLHRRLGSHFLPRDQGQSFCLAGMVQAALSKEGGLPHWRSAVNLCRPQLTCGQKGGSAFEHMEHRFASHGGQRRKLAVQGVSDSWTRVSDSGTAVRFILKWHITCLPYRNSLLVPHGHQLLHRSRR